MTLQDRSSFRAYRMMQCGENLLTQTAVPVAVACNRSMVATNYLSEMKKVDLHTLILHGDHDMYAPLELT